MEKLRCEEFASLPLPFWRAPFALREAAAAYIIVQSN